MSYALYVFIGSVVLFAAFSVLVGSEKKKGERLFLSQTRAQLDRLLVALYQKTADLWEHFVHYVVKLGWYYSLHSLLKAMLRLVVSAYDYLESRFERNLKRARVLQKEKIEKAQGKSHLEEVAAHKEEVSLTPEQGVELRDRKLEERD